MDNISVFILLFLQLLVHRNICLALEGQVDYVKLTTKFGNLIGAVEQIEFGGSQLMYSTFRGLPYSQAPIGDLRWQDPVAKPPFPNDFLYNATMSGPQCPQWITQDKQSVLLGSEDCLYADVFVPFRRDTRLSPVQPLKIMVLFHGGGFIVNSNRNELPLALLEKNTIIITFNYRLSIFGYLSTGKELAGNYGPLDQIQLLKWVQLYGRDFGGDTSDVTIFGISIGAVSIHYLLLTNLASGLFHKAIMESGSAFCERSLVPNPLDIATKIGLQLGCSTSTPSHLVMCLRSKSTVDLMTATKTLAVQYVLPSVLGPVIDKNSRPIPFLPDFPEKLKIVNKVPIIAGITENEGLTSFVKLWKGYTLQQLNDLAFIGDVILPQYLNLIMRSRKNLLSREEFIRKLTNEVLIFYEKQFRQDPILTLVGILGDLWINTCHRKTLESLCEANSGFPVYGYLFTHRDKGISPSDLEGTIEEMKRFGINHPILDTGVGHTDEALYLLQTKSELNKFSIWRNKLTSNLLSSLWTDFANGKKLYTTANGTLREWTSVCYPYGTGPSGLTFPLQEINLDSNRLYHNFRIREVGFWWQIHYETFLP